jgi:hypothetical protein
MCLTRRQKVQKRIADLKTRMPLHLKLVSHAWPL